MKLLLVDDTKFVRVIVRQWCMRMGLKAEDIVEADNGIAALRRFEENSPDAVITDWGMPVMDGLTLVREIRKRNKDVSILMLTAHSDRSQVVAAIQAGADDYLLKPFSPELLKSKLSKLILLSNEDALPAQPAEPVAQADIAAAVAADIPADPVAAKDPASSAS